MALHASIIRSILPCCAVLCAVTACETAKKPVTPAPAPKVAQAATGGFKVDYDDWAKVGYKLDWSGFPFPDMSTPTVLSAGIYQDSIVLLEKTSQVALLESGTGERRWATELANPLTKFVGLAREPLDPSRLIVSSESEAFTLAMGSGSLLAREQFERVVDTRPLLVGNVAIFGTSTGEVFAHLIGRNVKSWGFQSRGSISATPVRLSDGTIAAVSQGGDVMFLTSRGQMTGRGTILGGVATDPVTDGDLLFIAGLDQSVWCFAPSGTIVWRYRTSYPLHSQPTVYNGILYVAIPKEGLTALEAISGKLLWQCKEVAGTVIASRAGRVLVWDAPTGTLAAVDPVDGGLVAKIAATGVKRIFTDAMDNPNLYAINTAGVVGKFIPRD